MPDQKSPAAKKEQQAGTQPKQNPEKATPHHSSGEVTFPDYNNTMVPTWCPGCGDYGILMGLKQAIVGLQFAPYETFIVWGIGCSGNMSNWVNCYGVHGLHGRALPVATAAKLVNPKLNVIVEGGDGDGYGIGLGHFIHAMRRNLDITYVVHNNLVYGLTTGQTSPTSEKGFKTKSTPSGVIERPINPIALALSSDATFIARSYSGDVNHVKDMIMQGINHKGFALIDILQPCVTFNDQNTYDWFSEKVYKLEEEPGFSTDNKPKAYVKALEWGPKIPMGVFFKEDRATYKDELDQLDGTMDAVVDHDITNVDITKSFEKYA